MACSSMEEHHSSKVRIRVQISSSRQNLLARGLTEKFCATNAADVSSNLTEPTKLECSSMVERMPDTHEGIGSSPITPTNWNVAQG